MFGFSYLKLAIAAAVALVIATLSFTAHYYHGQWVEAQATIAAKTVELNSALEAAKQCSEATDALVKKAQEKEAAVQAAQAKAQVLAKKNQALAGEIMSWEPKSADRCVATQELFKDYKARVKNGPQ